MSFWTRWVIRFLCWSVATLFVHLAYADSDAESLAEAKKHLDAGLAYYDDPTGPRYEEAYREFHAAYAIHPSYKILANIGTCALYLERDAEAIDAYEKYLKQAKPSDIPPKKRALMQSDIKTLRASLVSVNVEVRPERLTLIDERFPSKGPAIVNRYEIVDGSVKLGMHPGAHRITAHREGYEDQRWEFDAPPGSSHSHRFELVETKARSSTADELKKPGIAEPKMKENVVVSEAQPRVRPTPVTVYIGLAATVALAGAATVTGLMALSSRDEFVKLNDGTQVNSARDARDEMRRYMLMTDIAVGAALVSAGITTYLYVSRSDATPARDSGPNHAVRIVPSASDRHVGVSLLSNF